MSIKTSKADTASAEVVSKGNGMFPTKVIPKEEFEKKNYSLRCRAGKATSKKIDDSTLFMEVCGRDGKFRHISIRYDEELVGFAPNELVTAPDGSTVMCIGVTADDKDPDVWFVMDQATRGLVFWPGLKNRKNFIDAGFAKISTSAV